MWLLVWWTRMKFLPGMGNINWTERIGTENVRCRSWPLVGLFTSRRRVPLLVTGVNMAKDKNRKKRLTFVAPLEAKQVRYILESQFADEKDGWCLGKQTVVSSWFENFHQSPAPTRCLLSTHDVILFAYQCRTWDNLFHFYATKLALPIVHWWRVKTCS